MAAGFLSPDAGEGRGWFMRPVWGLLPRGPEGSTWPRLRQGGAGATGPLVQVFLNTGMSRAPWTREKGLRHTRPRSTSSAFGYAGV